MKISLTLLVSFLSLQLFSQQTEVKDTSVFDLNVKLIKVEVLPPFCGDLVWALAQKFEVLESNIELVKPKNIIVLIQPCPEFLGIGFFVKDKSYKVKVSQSSGAQFNYTIINHDLIKKNLSFWIRDIKLQAQ